MERRVLEVGLFDVTEPEIRLVARSLDPKIVDVVRDALLAERQAELARLDPRESVHDGGLRLVPDTDPGDSDGE